MQTVITDRNFIKIQAEHKLDENDNFRYYLRKIDSDLLDEKVHALTKKITPQIDCTKCGACCKQLMINVTNEENVRVAKQLNLSADTFKEKYLEESLQGKMIMNTIPCHFLNDNKCTIYKDRFTECRAFPHLHENDFKRRLFGTLIHYSMCPIIYNVIEALKEEIGFIN
ncbi:MAG: YkgJ family cysteine cluster protein [Ferruginibacter sp.]|nr:YkgJ family cysteine cluster protein [Ferruginibacter sp.]